MSVAASVPLVGTALGEPHHDGSELYLVERPQAPGDDVVVRLRVPSSVEPESVLVRYLEDGEPRAAPAEVDEENERETWWRARFPAWNPSTRYRWLLNGGNVGWAWVDGAGTYAWDGTDAADFVVAHDAGGPAWHADGVVYEIFPDRFASSELGVDAPAWALPRPWHVLPTPRGRETGRELYGGDLRGIEQRLDHVERLGATALYLTPFFPARSSHRYDATTFDRVDPLLGGDEALDSLVRAAHGRGLRVIGDLTANHTGAGHEWFLAAQAEAATERSFYLWDEGQAAGYHSWLGHASLPKLDWRSPELRSRFAAIVTRWLERGLDGWRIDVANMTGRHHDADVHLEVARLLRAAAGDALLVAEHAHDFRPDLPGGGWQGVMNYSGFMRPVWTWLCRDDLPDELQRTFWGLPVGLPRLDGHAAAAALSAFRAGLPWTAVAHSWTLLDSHDTARFRTVAGGRERQLVGIGLQMTTPGVPCVFAGDEIGLEGDWGEDARRPMPWQRPESWDGALFEDYRRLIALRRSSAALREGGCRWAHVAADCLAYLRESSSERLLCLASRDLHAPLRLPLGLVGASALETVYGADAVLEGGDALLPADGPSFHVWRLIDG